MQRKEHWEQVYLSKPTTEVSWFQSEPTLSLQLIKVAANRDASVIDVGGGASLLVDRLLDAGYERLAVLDISAAALDSAKQRLKDRAAKVRWIAADITAAPDLGQFDVWHDRAVFHFLTSPDERRRYIETAARTIAAEGTLMLATFAPTGPQRCSGLDVQRWDAEGLARELGERFRLVEELRETHTTPQGKPQDFVYCSFRPV